MLYLEGRPTPSLILLIISLFPLFLLHLLPSSSFIHTYCYFHRTYTRYLPRSYLLTWPVLLISVTYLRTHLLPSTNNQNQLRFWSFVLDVSDPQTTFRFFVIP